MKIDKKLLKKLGWVIKVIRTHEDLSQAQLAAKLSLSRASIAKLEAGITNIGIGSLTKYAQALNVSIEVILKDLMRELKL